MTENMGKGPPDRGKPKNQSIGEPREQLCSLNGGMGYDLRKPGGHLGNVGLASGVGNFREGKT